MKNTLLKIIFGIAVLGGLSFSSSTVTPTKNTLKTEQSVKYNCRYVKQTAKSTGNRCKHCI